MRKFSSYGPLNTKQHYYVPRKALVEQAVAQLLGQDPDEGGHYITVWAPRQAGKTWVMREAYLALREQPRFDVVALSLQHLKTTSDVDRVAHVIARELIEKLSLEQITVESLGDLDRLFKKGVLRKPLILILDEFDALPEAAISGLAGVLRNIYNSRQYQSHEPGAEKDYLLHGVALIGVRSVLGIENVSGSPFNVVGCGASARSLHIPNLTPEQVREMFRWYERESGQKVEQAVVERLFYETRGQPGLVGWFGELLTETYNEDASQPIDMRVFERALLWATSGLGNANVLNIISKAKQAPYKDTVLELFETAGKTVFRYDDARLNFLYLNGVIDIQETPTQLYVKFPSPFVQKRLFNYFAHELFGDVERLHAPFEDLDDTITPERLHVPNLLRRYERYLQANRERLLKDAPRKSNLRPYEAVYHFNLYMYLSRFLDNWGGQVYPEFPTGNGKIDLLIRHGGQEYGVEVKSYSDEFSYRRALEQAARYGRQLGLDEITLVFFVEHVDDANRARHEAVYQDHDAGVTVRPVFVETSG
jgi:hypothetical protein